MSIITTNLSYTYLLNTPLETKALDSVSLTFENGEYIGIMGNTGCGKSTLIQLLAGLLIPSSGNVFLNGDDINDKKYRREELHKKVGILFQYPEYQLFETTVEKDVAFALNHSGLSKSEVTQNVRRALETVGFDYEKVKFLSPLGLSGGEKRRVAIAGVLAQNPEVLILDEPIAGLDPLGRKAFLELTDSLNKRGVTIIMVSHNADALAEHAKRILILENGQLIMDGLTKDVFKNTNALRKKNIGISQARDVADNLCNRGFKIIPGDIVKYDELISSILRTVNENGGLNQ